MFDARRIKGSAVSWIRGYFEEKGRGCCAVVGISGGKDSSVTAALCVEALGKNRVFGVLMPRGEQYDINISRELVSILGIKHCEVNIKDSVDALLASINAAGMTPTRQAEVNTPARIRMTTLYAVSAIVNGRVVNTCNLSEDWVGYSTKFGDSAGDLSPLANLTVTEVRAVGRELGLPSNIVDKVPEDGLSGLSDEENLGFTYAVLDRYIREGTCDDPAVKEKIDTLHKQNLHKLQLMPCFEYNP
ncbi:MAG: NAD(+) synthase [Chitinispirillia bacterium]|nr:NAD(+) synthase [Chitinispirillia bacterium]MCL2269289.1 NAD(+) synthase [Chitinispirillia bacterium]